jgi:5-methylcytosine-specific restriction endonuclease McrA
MKQCNKCGELLPLEAFYKSPGSRDGLRGDCKGCNLAVKAERYKANPQPVIDRARAWQRDNKEKKAATQRAYRARPDVKRRDRDLYLKRTYGIGVDDYEARLEEQGGGCAICGRPPRADISLHIDHEKVTGTVRALLCFKCNNLLGDVGDDSQLLRAAADYLDSHFGALARARVQALKALAGR